MRYMTGRAQAIAKLFLCVRQADIEHHVSLNGRVSACHILGNQLEISASAKQVKHAAVRGAHPGAHCLCLGSVMRR